MAKARTPTSAPGNSPAAARAAAGAPRGRRRRHGFTLLEVLMVLVLTALVASLVGVALRDSAESSLEQEAQRLSALLEGARAESRTAGVPVRFEIGTPGGDRDFRFLGWPGREPPPQRWLHPEVRAEIVGAAFLVLGPEPLIGAQRVRLWLADRQVVLATDGLGPFAVQGSATP